MLQEVAGYGSKPVTCNIVWLQMCNAMASRRYILDQGSPVYHGTSQELITDEEIKNRYLTLTSVGKTIEDY